MTITKTEAKRLARDARRHGYYDTGSLLWLACPKCAQRVEEDKQPASRVAIVKQLDAMMLHHFDYYCSAVNFDGAGSVA